MYLRNKDLIRTYKSNHIDEALGLGTKVCDGCRFSQQNMYLKKLFKQWNLALQAKQSMAEAYQSIADTLGAVTGSFGYTQLLQSQMSVKAIDEYSVGFYYSGIATTQVERYKQIQEERSQTFLQLFQVLFIKFIQRLMTRYQSQSQQKLQSDSKGVHDSLGGYMRDSGLVMASNFGEAAIRVTSSEIKSSQLQQEQRVLIQNQRKVYLD